MGVVALLLISTIGTSVAVSQQAQKAKAAGEVAEGVSSKNAVKVPISVIHSGYGFALANDSNEFHVLRVNILKVKHIHPMEIRGLMGENKSISEIRAEIEEKGGAPFYQGHMRLGENHYRLVNMSVAETESDRTFDADLVGLLGSAEPSEDKGIAGHISVTVMRYEGVWTGEGTLTMNEEDDYSGDYRVLLDVLKPGPILRGR